jgi:Arc/MetJ-type ribon-helix-helix transcriptional regulator
MSIEIPVELHPQIAAAVASGTYATEQELVSDILRATVPVLVHYQKLRSDVQESLSQMDNGRLRVADFDALRKKIVDEFDESGTRK